MVTWLIPLIVSAVATGASALATYATNKAAKKASAVDTGAIPGPYQPSPVNIGGIATTGTQTPLISQAEMAQAEAALARLDPFLQSYVQNFTAVNGYPPTEADITQAAEKIIPQVFSPEEEDILNRYDTAQTMLAEGSAVGSPDGTVMALDTKRVSDLFAEQQFQQAEYAKARGQQAAGVAEAIGATKANEADAMGGRFLQSGTDRMGAVAGEVAGRGANVLDQGGLDVYRAQSDEDRARLAALMGQEYAGEVGARGLAAESRGLGLQAATGYLDQIAQQEAMYRDAAMGVGPSVAELERQRALEQQTRSNLSIAASSRDPNAYRQALNANASAGGQAAFDAALLRAQEIEAARQGWVNASGARAGLQGYYGDVYGQDLGLQGTYASLQPGTAGQLASATANRGGLEYNAANANTGYAVETERNRDVYTTAQQDLADSYAQQGYATASGRATTERGLAYDKASEEKRLADALALGSEQNAWAALYDQANTDVRLQEIAANSANQYGANVADVLEGNAERGSAIAQTTGAGYLSAIGNGFSTFTTLTPQNTNTGAPSAISTPTTTGGTPKTDKFNQWGSLWDSKNTGG